MVRKAGFRLILSRKLKTINTPPHLIELAKNSRYINELRDNYSYGVQLTNPLFE